MKHYIKNIQIDNNTYLNRFDIDQNNLIELLNKIKNVLTNLSKNDEFLNCLCIMNVAIGYYILFVCCNDNKYYFFNKNMYKDELELSTGNELTKEKLVEIIEDLNKSPFNNDTLRIQSISGLKIYKEPIAIFSQKMI